MIIKEIKLRERLFFGDEIVVVTDKDKFSFKAEWDENFVKKLNEQLNGFKLQSSKDFSSLRERLKNLDDEKYFILENAIAKNVNNLWSYFNPSPNSVPRLMSIVIRKNKGIKEFIVFSLNSRTFLGALEANRHVADRLRKQIRDLDNMKEEDILMILKEAVDKEHEIVDFELRIGVVFNNYENGKYVYSDRSFGDKDQFDFVSKLVKKYSVAYVENPFHEKSDMYKKLVNLYRKSCLICMNPKIEYGKKIDKDDFNTAFVKFKNLAAFSSDVNYLKGKKFNIITNGRLDAMDAAFGLGIPLVKLGDDNLGEEAARRLANISEEIIFSRRNSGKP